MLCVTKRGCAESPAQSDIKSGKMQLLTGRSDCQGHLLMLNKYRSWVPIIQSQLHPSNVRSERYVRLNNLFKENISKSYNTWSQELAAAGTNSRPQIGRELLWVLVL